jgi:hypothetical protein
LEEILEPLERNKKPHCHQRHWVSLPEERKNLKKEKENHGVDVSMIMVI